MKGYYSENKVINISDCDYSGKLSIPSTFRMLQDLATSHAEILGIGYETMIKKNMYWVAIKTVLEFEDYPKMLDEIKLETFPSEPNKIRCDRNYNVYDMNNNIIIQGKTEWVVINIISKRPEIVRDVYPSNMEYVKDKPITSIEFSSFNSTYDDFKCVGSYTVNSQDIDLGGHLNNAEYLRVVFGYLTTKELESFKIKRVEVNYKTASYELESLKFFRKDYDDKIEFVAFNNLDKIVVNIIITKEKN